MEPLLSIYPSHDSSICVKDSNGNYRIFEFERLLKERFVRIDLKNDYKDIYNQIKSIIIKECNIDQFDKCYYLYDNLPENHIIYLKEIFNIKNFIPSSHHLSHAACSFYQSSFDEALVISYDGGGLDGGDGPDRITYFNIYKANRKSGIIRLKYIPYDLGTAYGLLALPIKEITKTKEDWEQKFLSFSGKIMGLVAYSTAKSKWLDAFKEFYKEHKHVNPDDLKKSLSKNIKLQLNINSTSGQLSYDIAATSQKAFEEVVLEEILPFIKEYNLPICLTGGCALNVILNQKLKDMLDVPVFIPPNPSDCGLALGAMLLNNPVENPVDIMYAGFPILDIDELSKYVSERNAKKISTKEIAELLAQGKIIGLMRGNSECGPRALGNRSILCDPSYPNMKNILNDRVKYREWFRPFAPMVKSEDVSKYFHFSEEASFMSFSPKVKDEWKNLIPAVVHKDDTSRVQTVSKQQNEYIYQLLSDFEEVKGFGVILNTSFNIKGKPILTTIKDALEVLNTTELDMVVIDGWLFTK